MYLKIQNGTKSKSYGLTESYAKPYIVVKNNSVLPLTTNTTNGMQIKVKINNVTYRPLEHKTVSSVSKYSLTKNNSQGLSSITNLTKRSTTNTRYGTKYSTTNTRYGTKYSTTNTRYGINTYISTNSKYITGYEIYAYTGTIASNGTREYPAATINIQSVFSYSSTILRSIFETYLITAKGIDANHKMNIYIPSGRFKEYYKTFKAKSYQAKKRNWYAYFTSTLTSTTATFYDTKIATTATFYDTIISTTATFYDTVANTTGYAGISNSIISTYSWI